MIYPTITEYIEAIRFSEDNFDKLTNLVPVLKDSGEPYYSSGNFAVVFKMKDKETGKLHAVKCFLKDQEGREGSYRKISNYLETIENRYLIKTKFLEKELFVDTKSTDQTEFPVVVMDWVEGVPLDVYIREKINDKMYLEYLCYTFSLMAQNLIEQEFAHGDLKPDNILVKEDGMLVLVDYDGMYVPEMFGERSRELGSPDFQHPDRKLIDFDKHLDDFSLASILLSLKLISIDPLLLDKFGDKDRLLFSQKDYRNFYTSEINKVIVDFFENKEVYNLYCLFIQGLGRKMIVWGKEMWKLLVPVYNYDEDIDLFKQLAEFDDDSKAYYGRLLVGGKGCEKNLVKGLEILFSLANKGNAVAQYFIGILYKYGEPDFPKDNSKVIHWLRKSIDQGFAKALLPLGNFYQYGYSVFEAEEKDMGKALECYTLLAEQGDSEAQYKLGLYYTEIKDFEKSNFWFSKSVKQGNIGAIINLGEHYEKGLGMNKDLEKAFEMFSKSANQDFYAKEKLADCYFYGKGTATNYDKAYELYSELNNNGIIYVQYELGLCYEFGKGVAKNLKKAFECYSKYAEFGDARSQYRLGVFYANGLSVPKNIKMAFQCFFKSAEQGNADAQSDLGIYYLRGLGVAQDINKAFAWLSKSAKNGNANAQYCMGLFYETGTCVSKNESEAIEWFEKSSNQGNLKARNKLNELMKNKGGVNCPFNYLSYSLL